MYLRQPTTTTEAQALIGMVQYYIDMWPRWSHVLSPIIEASINPNNKEILFNEELEVAFCELKCMISAETLLNYPD